MKSREKKIRILLIDDDAEDRVLLEETLFHLPHGEPSFLLEHANTLEIGIRALSKGHIDVVLLDLHLPDSKGIETFLKINRSLPDVPVIILSALYDDQLALEAVRRGAQDYLFKKDAHHDLLVRTIRFAVERHRLSLEVARANARLEKLALIDPVTELFNRQGLQEILSHELQRAQRKSSELLVILVDLDDFKKINNALGHTAGDVVLKEVSTKLKSSLRATDYVGRVGGDEFMVFLPDTRFGEGRHIAEKIRLAISTTIVSMSSVNEVKVTASLGLVNAAMMHLEASRDAMNDLISRVHLLLHNKKKSIKNHVSFDENQMYYESIADIPALLADEKKYYPLIQPIVRLADGAEIGYEFLSRSLVKGFEMPDDFFRAALEANMLSKVDYQCLKVCLGSSLLVPEGSICHVNLFPSTMMNVSVESLIEYFTRLMQKRKLTYCIEISEQQIIGDPSYLVGVVTLLQDAGIQIAIDDLGFGRSCLESLILLEPDIVKIDKKCVTGAAGEEALMRSLKRLIKMAKSLGSEVIAEGIETQQDLELVKSLGVKVGQGYFLGKPRPLPNTPRGKESFFSGSYDEPSDQENFDR